MYMLKNKRKIEMISTNYILYITKPQVFFKKIVHIQIKDSKMILRKHYKYVILT